MFHYFITGEAPSTIYEVLALQLDCNLQDKENVVIVSGTTDSGIDTLAKQYATDNGYEHLTFPLLEEDDAEFKRDEKILRYLSEQKEKGTAIVFHNTVNNYHHCFSLCKEFHIPFNIILSEGE